MPSVYPTSDESQASSTLRSDAVLVDPETKAHVRIEHQVSDSTAANVGVLVSMTGGKLYENHTEDRRNLQHGNSVRGARSNVEEHEMLSE